MSAENAGAEPMNGAQINSQPGRWIEMIKRPSAFLPIAMSLIALAVLAAHVARFGSAREADEGAAAHVWQFLMVAQVPIILFFAGKWLRRAPREASLVLALQLVAAASAVTMVYVLGL